MMEFPREFPNNVPHIHRQHIFLCVFFSGVQIHRIFNTKFEFGKKGRKYLFKKCSNEYNISPD